MWMRSTVVDLLKRLTSQCGSRNCPGLDPSIVRHSGILGAAVEAVLNEIQKKNSRYRCHLFQGFGSGSVSGSALIWVAGSGSALIWVAGSGSAFKLRIRIREGKNDHKNRKKSRIFMFLSTGFSLLRAEGFSCILGVLYGGLGISKLQFLIKKIEIKFPALNFFQC